MYADKMTDSMKQAIDETERRRAKQVAYNEERGIDPQPLRKKIADILDQVYLEADDSESVDVGGSGRNASSRTPGSGRVRPGGQCGGVRSGEGRDVSSMPRAELADLIKEMTEQMMAAARDLAIRTGGTTARRDRRPEEKELARHGRRGPEIAAR